MKGDRPRWCSARTPAPAQWTSIAYHVAAYWALAKTVSQFDSTRALPCRHMQDKSCMKRTTMPPCVLALPTSYLVLRRCQHPKRASNHPGGLAHLWQVAAGAARPTMRPPHPPLLSSAAAQARATTAVPPLPAAVPAAAGLRHRRPHCRRTSSLCTSSNSYSRCASRRANSHNSSSA